MEHFYEPIQGWFDYQEIFKKAIKKAENGSKFVEMGAWLGKSTSFFAVEILNSDKDITLYVVDTWEGSPEQKNTVKEFDDTGITLYDRFLENMKPVLHDERIKLVRKDSVTASKLFDDKSLDFVFLDGSHYYSDFIKDVEAWSRKIKPNGVLSGHDYKHDAWKDVATVILEKFPQEKINEDVLYSFWIDFDEEILNIVDGENFIKNND